MGWRAKPASHVQTLIFFLSLSDWQKRGGKKCAVPHSSPSLVEVKKKGKMKKLSQPAEEDLIVGLQRLVREAWLHVGLLYQTKQSFPPSRTVVGVFSDCGPERICGFFFPLQDLHPETRVPVGTGLVFDEQLNDFHCLWDDR